MNRHIKRCLRWIFKRQGRKLYYETEFNHYESFRRQTARVNNGKGSRPKLTFEEFKDKFGEEMDFDFDVMYEEESRKLKAGEKMKSLPEWLNQIDSEYLLLKEKLDKEEKEINEKLKKSRKLRAKANFERGRIAHEDFNYREALTLYTDAVDLDPENEEYSKYQKELSEVLKNIYKGGEK